MQTALEQRAVRLDTRRQGKCSTASIATTCVECAISDAAGRLLARPTEVATSAIVEHRLNSRNDPSRSNSLCQSRRCKPEIHVEASQTIWFRARRSAFAGPKINPGTGIARQLISS
jgi:hypothetical protein